MAGVTNNYGLKIYNPETDGLVNVYEWFNDISGMVQSNMITLDDALSQIQDQINNTNENLDEITIDTQSTISTNPTTEGYGSNQSGINELNNYLFQNIGTLFGGTDKAYFENTTPFTVDTTPVSVSFTAKEIGDRFTNDVESVSNKIEILQGTQEVFIFNTQVTNSNNIEGVVTVHLYVNDVLYKSYIRNIKKNVISYPISFCDILNIDTNMDAEFRIGSDMNITFDETNVRFNSFIGKSIDSDKLDGLGSDEFIQTVGDQMVDGIKTFNDNIVNNIEPSESSHLTNKGYVDGEVEKLDNRTTVLEGNLYKPNLLINSNFKVSELVNQRGETTYNTTHVAYTFDMWHLGGSGGIVDLTGEYVRVNKSDGTGRLSYYFDNFKELEGKTVTLTLNSRYVDDIGYDNLRVYVDDIAQGAILINQSNEFDDVFITFTMPDEINAMVRVDINTGSNSLELNYIKLEIGDVATRFIDDDIVTKLSKCQRYLRVLDKNNSDSCFHNEMGSGFIFFNFYYNKMRIAPSVTIEGDLVVYIVGPVATSGFSFVKQINTDSRITIKAAKNNHGYTAINCPILIFKDNAKIILSAEV